MPSMSREDINKTKKQRERAVTRDLTRLGLAQMPSCQHLQDKSCRNALVKARTTGEVDALRAAMLKAKQQLGLDDPLVVDTGKLVSKVENGLRSCRDVLARECLNRLPTTTSELAGITKKLRQLPLGTRLWEEPLLSLCCEKVKAWRTHQTLIEEFIERLQVGAEAYCDSWASLALTDSPAKNHFGGVLTKELVALPHAGMLIVRALQKALHKVSSVVADDEYGFVHVCLMRASNMLLNLDKPTLGLLFLRGEEHALQAAASWPDMMVFFMISRALSSQLLLIQPQFQRKLEHAVEAAKMDTMLADRRAAEALGKMLDVSPSELCFYRLPNGGLSLRLYPETGQHPSARHVQDLLGKGVALQKESDLKEFGVDAWRPCSLIHDLYENIDLCRRTRDEKVTLEALHAQALANLAQSEAEWAEAEKEVERCAAWKQDAEKQLSDAKAHGLKTMQAKSAALMKEDASEEEIDAAQKADDAAAQREEEAKQNLSAAELALDTGHATQDRIASELKIRTDDLTDKSSQLAAADTAAANALSTYLALMQGPIAPRQSSKRQSPHSFLSYPI